MENKTESKTLQKKTIFTNLNFVKNNKINYNYKQCIKKMKSVTDKLENLINIIDNSIGKENSKKWRNIRKFNFDTQRRPISATIVQKRDKAIFKENKKKKLVNSSRIISNNNYNTIDKKKIYKLKTSISMILDHRKGLNEHNSKKLFHSKYGSNTQNSSILAGSVSQRRRKLNTNRIKKDSSTMNAIFSGNVSTNKVNNSSMITVYYPNHNIIKNKRPQSATLNRSSIKNYNYRKHYFRSVSSCDSSKNFSNSRHRTLTNFYFENIGYFKLRSKYLMDFLHNSKTLKDSYKKDLKNVYMNKKTREIMKIAKKEIKMKDPEYHKKQIFKNIIKVKKTLKFVQKMREEQKYQMEYYGPGNINNKGYIRKKNANLIRFCDQICQMKDEQFYKYQKLLNELYTNLLKNAVKIKYKITERKTSNEKKKMETNEKKINKLISYLTKH